jgi:hypothetical protein
MVLLSIGHHGATGVLDPCSTMPIAAATTTETMNWALLLLVTHGAAAAGHPRGSTPCDHESCRCICCIRLN